VVQGRSFDLICPLCKESCVRCIWITLSKVQFEIIQKLRFLQLFLSPGLTVCMCSHDSGLHQLVQHLAGVHSNPVTLIV
jgi:hypothetical protein